MSPKPPPFASPETALRLRFYFGGRLRDEVWLDAADPESMPLATAVSGYHVRLADLADAVGVPWMVEVYDPAAPEDRAYIRYGTDAEGMIQPGEIPPQFFGNHVSGPLPRLDDHNGQG